MASFSFYTNNINVNGSALGFFGSSFGNSINVGSFNDSSYICSTEGTVQGPQGNNIKYAGHPSSGYANGAGPYNILDIPNYLATLNVRFTHSTPVKLQNYQIRFFDRTNINNSPSGTTIRFGEIIHPSLVSTGVLGSGSSSFVSNIMGSSYYTPVAQSPGMSGLGTGGLSNTTADRHDGFFAISVSPDSVGSKLFALYCSAEYL